jgi:outer membrane biosynthesis protein TonB
MAGSVTLVATIGPNGEVQSVSGGGGSLGPIIGCLKGVVQSAAFSPPDGGKAVVSIPITFVKQ